MFSKLKFITTLSLSLCFSSCGFLRDNKAPSLIREVKSEASMSTDCPEISKASSESELRSAFQCQNSRIDNIFAKTHPHTKDQFSQSELTALINTFVAKDNPISDDDTAALLNFKQIIAGGSSTFVTHAELAKTFDLLSAHAHLLYLRMHAQENESASRSEIESFLNDFFAASANSDASINRDAFVRIAKIAQRSTPTGTAHDLLGESSVGFAYDFISSLFGYKPDSALPIATFSHSARLFKAMSNFVDVLSSRYQSENNWLGLRQSYEASTQAIADEWVAAGSYAHNGALDVEDFTRLLEKLKTLDIEINPGQKINFTYDSAVLARRLFIFKSKLFGGDKQSFDATSIHGLLSLVSDLYFSIEPWNVLLDIDATDIPSDIRAIPSNPDVWVYYNARKKDLVSQSYGSSRALGYLPFKDLLQNYNQSRVITAAALAFDDDGNGVLDARHGSSRNELRSLVGTLAFVFDLGSKLSAKHVDLNDVRNSSVDQASFADSLLKGDLVLSSLVFDADNLGLHSNSDGSLNGEELSQVVRQVRSITSTHSWFESGAWQADARCIPYQDWNNEAFKALPQSERCEITNRANRMNRVFDSFVDNSISGGSSHDWYARSVDWLLVTHGQASIASHQFSADESALYQRVSDLVDQLFPLKTEDPDKVSMTNVALASIWVDLSNNIRDEMAPFGYLNHQELRRECPDIKNGSCWRLIYSQGKAPTISFTQLKAFFANRFNATSYTWLSRKFQAVLLALPEDTSRDLLASLIWQGDQVRELTIKLKKDKPNLTSDEWVAEILKLQFNALSSAPISFQELNLRALSFAAAISQVQNN